MKVSASTPEAAKSTGTWPTACTASVCTGMPCSAAISTTSSIGCSVPTSLLAHMTEISATEAGSRSIESRSASRSMTPWDVDGQQLDVGAVVRAEPEQRVEHGVVLDRGGEDARARGSSARRAQKMPLIARLSASVPPEVKTTSPGRAPIAPAMVSRDSSTTRRASRPEACSELALPTSASCCVIASIATGSIGVVAAWSR